MPSYPLEALLLGLSTGPVCLAYCAPVLAPLVVADDDYKFRRSAGALGLFVLGRLAGYLAVGLVTGLAGAALLKHSDGRIFAAAMVVMGLVLIAFGLMKNFPEARLCRVWPGGGSSMIWPAVLGLLTGVNICPPFIAAITGAASLGQVSGSLIYFTAFFLGTAAFIPPLLALGPLSRFESLKSVAKVCIIIAGLWFSYKGTAMLVASSAL